MLLTSSFREIPIGKYPDHEKMEGYSYFLYKDSVYMACSRRGDEGAMIHIAAKGKAKLLIRDAVQDFVKMLFDTDWCRMVIATIKKTRKSVVNLAVKCDFQMVASLDGYYLYARYK